MARYIPPPLRNNASQAPVQNPLELDDNSEDEEMDNVPDKFVCIICHDVIQVPTRLLCQSAQGPDSCRSLACLRCVRTHLKLSKPYAARGTANCLICRNPIASGRNISSNCYRVVDDMFDIVDDAVKVCRSAFTCRTCGTKTTGQQGLWRHFRDECPDSTIQCSHPGCKLWGKRKYIMGAHAEDHIMIRCEICKKVFNKRSFQQHLVEEKNLWKARFAEAEEALKWLDLQADG